MYNYVYIYVYILCVNPLWILMIPINGFPIQLTMLDPPQV